MNRCDFKINDLEKLKRQVKRQDRCSLCGRKAVFGYWHPTKRLGSRCRLHKRKGYPSLQDRMARA